MIFEDATLGDAFAYILLQILGYVLGIGLGIYFLVWIILATLKGKKEVDKYVDKGNEALRSIDDIINRLKPN